MNHAHGLPRRVLRAPQAGVAGGKAPRDRQNANHTSLLTYFGPLSDPNRDRFDNENAVSVTKIASSLPFVQVRRGATSGNYRGT